MKDEIIYGHLNWSTDKDVQAYLSNRPAVLRFQDVGTKRSGLKTEQSGKSLGRVQLWCW